MFFISPCHRNARGGFSRLIFCRTLDFFRRRHAQNFLDGRDAGGDQTPAILASVRIPALRAGANLVGRALSKSTADFFIGVHPLENRVPAKESRVAAFAAADGFENRFFRRDSKLHF